jgi:nitrate reductase NapE component
MQVRTLPQYGVAPQKKEHPLLQFIERNTLLFILLHVPLGIVMWAFPSPIIATVHALLTVAVGVNFALTRPKDDPAVLWVAAYIMAADVAWRASDARVFYEYAKYGVCLVFILPFLRPSARMRIPVAPLIYFVFLLPSTLLNFNIPDFEEIREELSTGLSGPLVVAVSAFYFSNIRLEKRNISRMMLIALAPIVASAAMSTYGTVTADNLGFHSTVANFEASAGFGPNQMSNMLSLGAVFCWFLLLDTNTPRSFRYPLIAIMLWLIGQGMLTFSRGGIYATLLSIAVSTPLILAVQNNRGRSRIIRILAIMIVLFPLVVIQLDEFTGGALFSRFSSTALSRRDELANTQIELFKQWPIAGVGPTRSMEERSHLELTRVAAEHGLIGLSGVAILMIELGRRIWRMPKSQEKAWILGLVIYGIFVTFQSAFRNAMPAFLIAMAWLEPEPETHPVPRGVPAMPQQPPQVGRAMPPMMPPMPPRRMPPPRFPRR